MPTKKLSNAQREELRQMREAGSTYREIGSELGISINSVRNLLLTHYPDIYRSGKAGCKEMRSCCFKGLRTWLFDNDCSIKDLSDRTGIKYDRLHSMVIGRRRMTKEAIDILLDATGLTYEQAFRWKEDAVG